MSTQKDKLLVKDVQLNLDQFPIVSQNELVKETLDEMNNFHLGIACIVNKQNKLLGVMTDGDIRRTLLSSQKPISALFVDDALEYAAIEFKSVSEQTTLIEAVNLMAQYRIWDLPVVDSGEILKGLLHLHPAVDLLLRK